MRKHLIVATDIDAPFTVLRLVTLVTWNEPPVIPMFRALLNMEATGCASARHLYSLQNITHAFRLLKNLLVGFPWSVGWLESLEISVSSVDSIPCRDSRPRKYGTAQS